MKKIVAILLLAFVLILAACGSAPSATDAPNAGEVTETSTTDKEFTREELAQFNGKDGQPAYVAVDGVVYDVTESAAWANGDHNGYEAGKDLTDVLANEAPHDESNLDGYPVVGTLVD